MRLTKLSLSLVLTACAAAVGFAQEIDMVDPSSLAGATSKAFHPKPHD
jgi:hypothetical protein